MAVTAHETISTDLNGFPVSAGVTNDSNKYVSQLRVDATSQALIVSQSGFPAQATLADATTNPSLTEIQTFPMLFNGTTWDRMRSGGSLSQSTLNGTLNSFTNNNTGVLPAIIMGYDSTASANAYRAVAVDSSGKLSLAAITANQQMQVTDSGGTSRNVGFQNNSTTFPVPMNFMGNNAKQTYVCSTTLNSTIVAGDMFTLYGSGTKTIRISHIDVQITGASSSTFTATGSIIKRSTADSGGTSSSVTIIPTDSNNGAVTATSLAYTVAPTPGTTVGTVASFNASQTNSSVGILTGPQFNWNFGQNGQELVLRGTSQGIALNLATAAGSAAISITIIFTEES